MPEGAVNTTYTFNSTDVLTSDKMNNILDQSFITSTAIVGTTLEVASNKLKVRAQGVTSNELADGAVNSTAIAGGAVTPVKLANADFGDFTVASGVATLDNNIVTTAKILDANVTTAKIADSNITAAKLDGAQTGSAPIYGVRAWAKLNPMVGASATTAYKSGNYTRTATETTISIANHGLKANDKIKLDFTSGAGADGLYTVISSANANEFVVNHTGTATSGAVTAQFIQIQAAGNISSASWSYDNSNSILVNFATPMPDVNYTTIATGHHYPSAWLGYAMEDSLTGTSSLNTQYQAYIRMTVDLRFLNLMFIR